MEEGWGGSGGLYLIRLLSKVEFEKAVRISVEDAAHNSKVWMTPWKLG